MGQQAAVLGLVLLAATGLVAHAQNLELPKLPYDYDALEPVIDAQTMRIHHLMHHNAYLTTINKALTALRSDAKTKPLAKMGVDKLLQNLDQVHEPIAGLVRNGGGGFVNHILFWGSMCKGGKPLDASSALGKAVDGVFTSQQRFIELFQEKAMGVFGSGWVWLVYDTSDKSLSISSTANQDTPAMQAGKVPILGLDVWEHAYYLKYQNKRADYVSAWWGVVDWEAVTARYEAALSGKTEL